MGEIVATLGRGEVFHFSNFVPGLSIIHVETGTEDDLIERARELRGLIYAERDLVGDVASSPPNDPWFVAGEQWQFQNTGQTVNGISGILYADICALGGWSVRTDAAEVVVGVFDSGVNYARYDLEDNMWVNLGEIPGNQLDDDGNGYKDDIHGIRLNNCDVNYLRGDPFEGLGASQQNIHDPNYEGNHGSVVAGFVGARGDNDLEGTGGAQKVKIMSLAMWDFKDNPPITICASLSASACVIGFEYLINNGGSIVNCSWGFVTSTQTLYDAFYYLDKYGGLAVVAAHNDGQNIDTSSPPSTTYLYPSRYTFPSILVVGASDQCNRRATFSNYGATSVDIFAPGDNLRSFASFAHCPSYYCSGTSFAAPLASGIAALVWAENPSWTASQVVSRIKSTAVPVPCLSGLCATGGVLNASGALGGTCPYTVGPCCTP